MKRIFRLTGLLLVFIACIPATSNQLFGQANDNKLAAAFSREADWKLIATSYIELMDRLVTSAQPLASVDFNDENSFLGAVGLSRTVYLSRVEQVRAAAGRLIGKYAIKADCPPCRTTSDDVGKKLQAIAIQLQKNPGRYAEQKTPLISPGPGETTGWCCGWRFYACCTVCAGTISAFPVYLACCAMCFDSYCCKP